MRKILRFFTTIFYKPLLVKWLSKERNYKYQGIRLAIHPQVFHPGFFFSTKLLLRHLSGFTLHGKQLLELGAGSGLISISAARNGACVTASDINPVATEYLKRNALYNKVQLTVIHSDIFGNIPKNVYEIIAINPPYYFRQPVDWKQYAWNCGESGEYFRDLFSSLGNYIDTESVVLMVLCEAANRSRVRQIANGYGFEMECVKEVSNLLEKNFIYQIHPQ